MNIAFATKATVRRIAALVVIPMMAVLGTAFPAQAETSYSYGTVSAFVGCDFGYHTMYISGSFRLSDQYPQGAWIEYTYARWTVNPATLARTSDIVYTPWKVIAAKPGTSYYTTALAEQAIAQPTDLPGVNFGNVGGSLRASVGVSIWNGHAWQPVMIDTPQWYVNSYKNKPFENQHVCAGSA